MFSTKLRKGSIVELLIEKMAYGGQGVARIDGLVVFVKGTVAGDRVNARITRKKKDYAEARMVELLDPSPDRISPPCAYCGHCGGCQWQPMQYHHQLEFKAEHVRDAMIRIGGLSHVPVHDAIPSPKKYGYRNKMEFSFSDRPWLLPEEMERGVGKGDFALGLHVPGTYNKVIDIEACLLQHPTGNEILQEVKRYAKDSGISAYGLKSHQGFWRFLTLRHSESKDEWMVNIVTSEANRPVIDALVVCLSRRFKNIKTIVNNITAKKAGVAVGERETFFSGQGFLKDQIGPHHFQISANSFFQTNSLGAERLYDKVMEFAELTGTETVLDLYSGTGTIPIYLSGGARSLIGMEIAESAVLDAQRNCLANDVDNCRFILGDIRENLKIMTSRPDVLIIDPPRAGMHKDVLEGVMELATDRVVYVSCNPSTLARDLAVMSQDYEVLEIQPVDMFPHTYHIEAVAKLIRRKGRPNERKQTEAC